MGSVCKGADAPGSGLTLSYKLVWERPFLSFMFDSGSSEASSGALHVRISLEDIHLLSEFTGKCCNRSRFFLSSWGCSLFCLVSNFIVSILLEFDRC